MWAWLLLLLLLGTAEVSLATPKGTPSLAILIPRRVTLTMTLFSDSASRFPARGQKIWLALIARLLLMRMRRVGLRAGLLLLPPPARA